MEIRRTTTVALKVVDDFILIDISKIKDFDLHLGLWKIDTSAASRLDFSYVRELSLCGPLNFGIRVRFHNKNYYLYPGDYLVFSMKTKNYYLMRGPR